ncbi:MAG: hypothetical protein ABI150_11875 [Nitrobacter sp.]
MTPADTLRRNLSVGWNDKAARQMPASLIEQQDGVPPLATSLI